MSSSHFSFFFIISEIPSIVFYNVNYQYLIMAFPKGREK